MAALINPSKPASFPVVFGDSQRQKRSFISVSLNHKPQQPDKIRQTTIRKSVGGQHDAYQLQLGDTVDSKKHKYVYDGRQSSRKRTYLLMLDQEKHAFTLEPLQSQFRFNLSSANIDGGAQLVADQKSIELDAPSEGVSSDDELPAEGENTVPGGDGEDTEPDSSNPFDFRNYLGGIPGTQAKTQQAPSSAMPSPRPESPHSQPATKAARNTTDPPRSAPRAQKSTMRRTTAKKDTTTTTQTAARRNSTRKAAAPTSAPAAQRSPSPKPSSADEGMDDDTGFTLELDPEPKKKKKQSGFLTPNTGGPISLRSALSASPEVRARNEGPRRLADRDDEGEGGTDGDVDEIMLGSPAQRHTSNGDADDGSDDADAEMDEDYDEDLEGELIEALENEDQLMEDEAESGSTYVKQPRQEESESEEE